MAFYGNYGPILYRFRDKTRLVENGDFSIPHLYMTPPLMGTPSEFRHIISCEKKLEWWNYEKVEKFEDNVLPFRYNIRT